MRQLTSGRYANVTSTLALVVALGGTSYAAATITGKDIKNGTITSKDIKDQTVASKDLGGNSVTSAKVRNGTLLRQDFAAGQVPAGGAGSQGPKGDTGAQGAKGDTGATGATGATGTPGSPGAPGAAGAAGSDAIPSVRMNYQQAEFTTSSTSFDPIPNLNLGQTVTVPTGQQRRVLVTFSAESTCTGGMGDGACAVRITVDGQELNPGDDLYAFDSTDGGLESAMSNESHSMQRFSGILGPGVHTIAVQARVSGAATLLRLDDAVLTTIPIAATSP